MFFRKKSQKIPKNIHFVWLGTLPDEEARKNVEDWQRTNPDYKVNLWVDSGLFPSPPLRTRADSFAEETRDYEKFLEKKKHFENWARDFGIHIRDIAEIYHEMPNREFYDDAISGRQRNLAEGSDIARVYILLKEGGFYFDIKDIFPAKPLGTVKTAKGFLCHIERFEGLINNDILGCTIGQRIMANVITKMRENYLKIYKRVTQSSPNKSESYRELYAHRTSVYSSPDLKRGMDSRRSSTLAISGPSVLDFVLDQEVKKEVQKQLDLIPEMEGLSEEERRGPDFFEIRMQCLDPFAMSKQFFRLPKEQALSWGVSILEKDIESFKQNLQFNLCLLYISKIKNALPDSTNQETFDKLNALPELSPLLFTQLHQQFSSLHLPRDEIFIELLDELKRDEENLNNYLNEVSQECENLDEQAKEKKLKDILIELYQENGFDNFIKQLAVEIKQKHVKRSGP